MSQIGPSFIGQVYNPQTGQYEQKLLTYMQVPVMQPQYSNSQIYTAPTLQHAQSSTIYNGQNGMEIPTENAIPMMQIPATINIPTANPVQNQNLERQKQEERKIISMIHQVTESIKPTEISNTYLFFFGIKVLLQFMFVLYMIISIGFYAVRPKYAYVKEGGQYYFKATSKPVSDSNYQCTEAQNRDVLHIINQADFWVYFCSFFIVAYKIFFITKTTSQFKYLWKQKYISNSQKFDISYIDYINLFFDYVFVISISPLTAIVYEECANLRYGIYTFGAVQTYAAGIVFSLFSFLCLIILLECCKAETFDKLMYYPILILIVLPATAILAMALCGSHILSAPVNYYEVTTTYSDGRQETSIVDDSYKKLLVIFPIIGILFVIAFFGCMVVISFALIFAFCHPAMILYYILTIILTFAFLYKNRKGTDYRQQLASLYSLNALRNQYTNRFNEQFDNQRFDQQNCVKNSKYSTFQAQTNQYIDRPSVVLYQYNARQTCKNIKQYQTFYQGVILEKQHRMYQAQYNKPPINEVQVV
ncbi:transmembrane protein, putative (macronuclear) [Tetrahymena thermophila SB210]|uniref:Transmembrane protein, putative n=1 Tax=Tetrahymena thermophila (strain SB210) TaxID=312017 RepID=Q235H7_TETTS|nr:transmembrane protein, putative [Tetrahymena thermophila SB210]EAR92126.1 transmembrane protein, putative [Tetrahymena thermophila SB210]|eukprot:XP_001012371.1 transmembrane protein, putative [Tetrahymena thermophila SB210]